MLQKAQEKLQQQLKNKLSIHADLKSAALSAQYTFATKLEKFHKNILTHDPKRWLNKGWTQLYKNQNKITSVKNLNSSDTLKAKLKDGDIELKVIKIKPYSKEF